MQHISVTVLFPQNSGTGNWKSTKTAEIDKPSLKRDGIEIRSTGFPAEYRFRRF